MASQGAVVYALKYRSHLDFLFFNRRYQKLGVVAPEVAFDLNLWMWQPFSHLVQIVSAAVNYFTRRRSWHNPFQDGYFLKTIQEKRGSLLFLVDQVGFRQRFLKPREDPIRHLLEIQLQVDFPIFLVPQMVMYEKIPFRENKSLWQLFFGDSENPGRLRKLGLCLLKAKSAVVEVAEPVNLKEFLATAPTGRPLAGPGPTNPARDDSASRCPEAGDYRTGDEVPGGSHGTDPHRSGPDPHHGAPGGN